MNNLGMNTKIKMFNRELQAINKEQIKQNRNELSMGSQIEGRGRASELEDRCIETIRYEGQGLEKARSLMTKGQHNKCLGRWDYCEFCLVPGVVGTRI